MKNFSYHLKGLDCANCANKIQDELKKLDGASAIEFNFALQKLSLRYSGKKDADALYLEVKNIVNKYEPDVEVSILSGNKKPQEDTSGSHGKSDLFILGIGIVLFGIGFLPVIPGDFNSLVFIAAYLISGGGILIRAVKNIFRGQIFDENFLMSLATVGALAIQEYPEAVAVMLFYRVGELFEGIAVNKSRKSIKALLEIKPELVNLQTDSGIMQISPEETKIGDVIIVRPGERIPLDGVVLEGFATLDTSVITGESAPRALQAGETVLSGCINRDGVLKIKVEKSFEESTVSKILNLVENAASQKAPTESFIAKFAKYYTPFVVLASVLTALIPPLVTGSFDFKTWIYRALIFLVISCPCALVISVPLGFFGGIGSASKRGILVKGGNYLEALNKVNTIVFDKTGTLTKGVFKVTEIHPQNGYSEDALIELAALAEFHSNHPIAKSILEACGKTVDGSRIAEYREIPGHGVNAKVDGRNIIAGNDALLHMDGCVEHNTCSVKGTVLHVAVDGTYAGYIMISDEIREDSAEAINQLHKLGGMHIAMLTGDNSRSALKVAEVLKIDEVHAELLPHQKVEKLQEIKRKKPNSKLAFVGDGINDAPVLAIADVGIAMGRIGSDAAIEAADVVLMTDEPIRVAEAINIARRTRRIVWQNIGFAFAVKLAVLILGAGGMAAMWEAVFADVGVTVIAVFNAMRLIRK